MSLPGSSEIRLPHAQAIAGPADITIELTPATVQSEVVASPAPGIGAISSQASEIRTLLQHRLGVIAPVGAFAWGILLAVSLTGVGENLSRENIGAFTQGLIALNVVYLAAVTVLARAPRAWPLEFLRALEAGQYVLLCSAVAVLRIVAMRKALSPDFPATGPNYFLDATTSMTAFGFLIAITLAGVIFPNTRRRATVLVLGMTAIPLGIDLAFVAMHAERLPQIALAAMFSGQILLFAVTLALFASAKIEALRQEASAARREAREARALGPYVLKRRIGAGGMGEVYEAEHRLLKRPCAVKLIRPERAGDSQMLARFDREVKATARLKHPNTVEVFDYGRTEDGVFYYVMEYLDGLSLEELVEQHGPIPAARVVYLLRQVCGALREAHESGLVHRDIKPSNLLLCRYGGMYDVVKLLDFGLVQNTVAEGDGRLTMAGGFVGTPAYMAPEQAEGATPDARSDLYSLGATAFFLLTGRPPFEGKNTLDVLFAHRNQPPPSFAEVGIEAPAELESIVRRCLAKSPLDRFPDADSLAAALRRCGLSDAWSEEQAGAWWRGMESAGPSPVPAKTQWTPS